MCSTEKAILECLSRAVLLDNMKGLMFSFLEVRFLPLSKGDARTKE